MVVGKSVAQMCQWHMESSSVVELGLVVVAPRFVVDGFAPVVVVVLGLELGMVRGGYIDPLV